MSSRTSWQRPAQVSTSGIIRSTTKSGTMLEPGEIVLLPIPFSDLTSTRRRPVIVVSNRDYNSTTEDIVVVAMTSNLTPTTYSFVITSADLVQGTLNRP